MKISAILAVGKNNEIGLNGQLPWNSKEDMLHFKNITFGHCVLMGSNTYRTIGKPLTNRTNIVISQKIQKITGCKCFSNIEAGINFAKNQGERELFIIGGASIYKYFQEKNLLDRIYITYMIY